MTSQPTPRKNPLMLVPITQQDEQRLLGLAAESPDVASITLGELHATDFYADPHPAIFTAMRLLAKRGEPINLVSLQLELRRRNQAEAAAYAVASLVDANPLMPSPEEVASWIKALQARRKAAEAQDAQQKALRAVESGDPEQMKAALSGLTNTTFVTLAEHAKRTLMHADALANLPPTHWLIPGVLPTNKISLLFGPPGIGKSFSVLDIALTVAQFANVIYIAAEDAEDYELRKEAWKQHHRLSAAGLYFWPEPLRLADLDAIDVFIGEISPLHPALIVIDPLADCMRGLNERDEEGMGAAVEALNRIRRATQAGMLVVHHTGWSHEHERGSSLLRGAARVVIRVARDEDDLVTISCEKINGGARFEKRYFRHIQVGQSVVPIPASKVAKSTELTEKQVDVLEFLTLRINDKGVRHTDIVNHFELPKSNVTRMLDKFLELGLISRRTKGQSELYSISNDGRDVVYDRVNQRAKEKQATNLPLAERLNWYVDTSEITDEARSAHAPQGDTPTGFEVAEGYEQDRNEVEQGWNKSTFSDEDCFTEFQSSSAGIAASDDTCSTEFQSSSAVPDDQGFVPFHPPCLYKQGVEQTPEQDTKHEAEEIPSLDDLFPETPDIAVLKRAGYRWLSMGKDWHFYPPTNETHGPYADKDEAIDYAWEHYRSAEGGK